MAVGRYGGELTLWDTSTWKKNGVLTGNTGPIYFLAFSPDGKLLAAAGMADPGPIQVKLYDVVSRKELADLSHAVQPSLFGLAFVPDSKTLAVTSKRLMLFDTDPPRLRASVPLRDDLAQPFLTLWRPGLGGPTLGSLDGTLMNYDGNTGKVLESWATGTSIKSLASSPDGKTVALGGPRGVIFHPSKSTLDQFAVALMAFSGDGSLLAAAGMDDRIYLWDANTSRLLDKFTGVSDKDRVDRFNANAYKTNNLIPIARADAGRQDLDLRGRGWAGQLMGHQRSRIKLPFGSRSQGAMVGHFHA